VHDSRFTELRARPVHDGRNFVDEFARALVNSLIVMPVVTSDVLKRMSGHILHQADHVLMK
jgi:hypothetical protein